MAKLLYAWVLHFFAWFGLGCLRHVAFFSGFTSRRVWRLRFRVLMCRLCVMGSSLNQGIVFKDLPRCYLETSTYGEEPNLGS